jgi:choline dehydrogenase-like flavoprotein
VIAGRLAGNLNAKILVLEAGPDNADLENVHMPGGLVCTIRVRVRS